MWCRPAEALKSYQATPTEIVDVSQTALAACADRAEHELVPLSGRLCGVTLTISHPAPTTRIRAHNGRCAVQPDLLCIQLRRGRRVNVKGNPKCVPNMGIFDGKLPSQAYLDAILVRREVGHIKTAAAALNYAMGLAGIEYHSRSPGQGNAMADRGKMQVQTLVLA